MRKQGYRCGRPHNIKAKTINFTNTNITNVTNVSNVVNASHGFCGGKRKHGGKRRHDRRPKLLRYCASGGFLDRDVARDMSDKDMCDGFCEVGSYAARGLAASAGRAMDGVGRGFRKMGNAFLEFLECYL